MLHCHLFIHPVKLDDVCTMYKYLVKFIIKMLILFKFQAWKDEKATQLIRGHPSLTSSNHTYRPPSSPSRPRFCPLYSICQVS